LGICMAVGRDISVEIVDVIRHEVSDDHLIIKFIDDSGEGICSCCILLSEV